jgi:capsular exopolysaccharide synthesis family protein
MSDIFDALQRSETERSGADSPAPTQATELLRYAERRAASKWETARALSEHYAAKEDAPRDTLLGQEEVSPHVIAEKLRPAVDRSSASAGLEIFDQFQTLQALVTAQSRLVCFTDTESPAAEAFRLLGVRLRDLRLSRPLRKMLITSTIPQEGKSMVAANLACTLALRAPQKTLLIEGDLRRPSLSQVLGVPSVKGLSDWLQGEDSRTPNIYKIEGPGFWLLPAGSAPRNSLELLQSARLPALMDQLSKWFDWIIVDSPPVLPLADVSVWTRLTDGVLLIVRQGVTEKRNLQKGVEALDLKKLIGALLNCSKEADDYGYYYRQPIAEPQNNNSTN